MINQTINQSILFLTWTNKLLLFKMRMQ